MTVRQGLATGSVSAAGVFSNGVEVNGDHIHPSSWEEWFLHASARQRIEALGLAQQQGLLYPHQFPPTSNGVKQATAGKETAIASLLTRLLAGKTEVLPRFDAVSISLFDADLDDVQQLAVSRALSTPDVFLLEGLPGAGKSRVVGEIIHQAAARGQRVLFLAAHAASLDVVLARLVDRTQLLALRLLDALEKPETLPPRLRGLALEEQRQSFLERTRAGARSSSEHHEESCRKRGQEAPLWAELRTCAERMDAIAAQQRALSDRLAGVDAAVGRDAGDAGTPLSLRIQQSRALCEVGVRDMETSLQTLQAAFTQADLECAELSARIDSLDAGYQAKKHGRFWSLAYWTNFFNSGIVAEMETVLGKRDQAQQQRSELQQQIEQLQGQCRARRERFERERQTLVTEEIDARRQGLQHDQQRLAGELQVLDEAFAKMCGQLSLDAPSAQTIVAIDQARAAWIEQTKRAEQQCTFARQWQKFVEESGPQLAARLPAFANLIASTIPRWQADAKFREAAGVPFDLVIIEDVETLTDVDLLKAARHGERCVLVAQTLAETVPQEKPVRSILTAAVPVTGPCHRLWQALGGEAGRWPCTWRRDQGRLVCQLVPLSDEDRQHLESEGLADAADIELRILHRPRSTPRLAQVIFGARHSFEDAFRFMVSEVQEFPLEPLGQTGWWCEDAQCVRRHLGPSAFPIQSWLTLEAGLRLGITADAAGEPTRIAAIEFDKSSGWDRLKADDWLGRHRSIHDAERTVFLQTPHRFRRPLAKLVQTVLRTSDWLSAGTTSDTADHACEFIAVPELTKREWPREGAGLELDLTVLKQADRLPAGLRHGLPVRGFANYVEAQALIRRVETWAQKQTVGSSTRVAVLALYQGQVELLRRLVQQSEILRNRTFPLEIALPSRMRQRECDLVFLSLTRSHASRAVAFGEDLLELPLALTRSRGGFFVFGDPGTLSKRTQWQGPLDHLDTRAAGDELARLARLCAYLQVQEHTPVHVNGSLNGKE